MGFRVIHDSNNQTIWCPVGVDDTLYVGQLVRANNEGVIPLAVASGLADQASKTESVGLIANGASANNQLFGVVLGTNLRTPVGDSTYLADKIAYVSPASASSSDYFGVEGPWGKGDRMSMVEVMPITAQTVLRGPLFNAAFGTALTVGTLSGTPTTTTATSSAVEAQAIASLATIYFRTGTVTGSYRITDDTSTLTAHTWDLPLRVAPASGDTIVKAGLRPIGMSRMQLDSEAMYIDNNAEFGTNYFLIDVLRLDLSIAGSEYVEFRPNPYMVGTFDDVA